MKEERTMYSICIKFKPESGWRSHIREFSDFAEVEDYLNEKWAQWPISVAYVFCDGKFVSKFMTSPAACKRMQAAWQTRGVRALSLMGSYHWR